MASNNKNLRGFFAIFLTQGFSLLGSAIVSFAIIWWITIQTGSGLVLSLATFVGMVPMLVLAPFAGVLVDRLSRKIVLIGTDLLQAIVTIWLIVLFQQGSAEVIHVLAVLAVRGVAQAFQLPAATTLPSLMVPNEKIPQVNALNQIMNSLIFIVSPGIGAVLLGFFSIGYLLWIDILTYIPAGVALLIVMIPKVEVSQEKLDSKTSFIDDFKEGFSYIKTSGLITLVASFGILSVFLNPIISLVPLFVSDFHTGTVNDLALVEVCAHVGMFLGSVIILMWKGFKPSISKIIVGALFLQTFMLAIGIVPSGQFIALGLAVLVVGFSISVVDVQFMSFLQIHVPQELQGRVFSSLFTSMKSLVPIALIFWGIVADFTGVQMVWIISSGLGLFIMILIILFTDLRNLDKRFTKELSIETQKLVQTEIPSPALE